MTDLSAVLKLVGDLVDKWSSFSQSQHTPLCAHLLGLAMKTVSQMALGETFNQDAQVVSFRKNHDAVSRELAKTIVELLDSESSLSAAGGPPADLVGDWEGLPGWIPG